MQIDGCPLCLAEFATVTRTENAGVYLVACDNCGRFGINEPAIMELRRLTEKSEDRSILSSLAKVWNAQGGVYAFSPESIRAAIDFHNQFVEPSLQRNAARPQKRSGPHDYADRLHKIDMELPIGDTVPDFRPFSVFPTTFEPREAWPALLSAYSLDEAALERLFAAGFVPLDRESIEWGGLGDPFSAIGDTRHLLIDRDYAVVVLPLENGRMRNLFLPTQTLVRYTPHYPVIKRESSAIHSLGAIRGHLGYHGNLEGNYFEPIEVTVSSRPQLDELVARMRENLASRPYLQLWFRGQPNEYLTEDLTDYAARGICPWRSLRDPSLAPSLCRRLTQLSSQWDEYERTLREFEHLSHFLDSALEIPAFQTGRLYGEAPARLGPEFEGLAPDFVTDWPEKGEAHHFERKFRGIQKLFFFQHYGIPSTVLDITRDLDVALFFANHRIETGRYVPVGPDPARILYIFTLHAGLDQFLDSRQLCEQFGLLRPLRQECGLITGASMVMRNAYARFLSIRIRLQGEIERADLAPDYLFPSIKEDAFLNRLIEFEKQGEISRLKAFVLEESGTV